jgi:hypothetical protein
MKICWEECDLSLHTCKKSPKFCLGYGRPCCDWTPLYVAKTAEEPFVLNGLAESVGSRDLISQLVKVTNIVLQVVF